ncbi:nucleotidyltransferase family protein [Candidatus Woesebacteria bacterium]|nr:nucleotidyltransferase family protein [Candidatus Woesebacteria bacterium]
MQALILSAGQGTRLYPLTEKTPKVMLKVNGKPMLQHHVELLKKHGINNIFINTYAFPQVIMDFFGDGSKFGVRITYSREDTKSSYLGPKLLGSAGALHNFKSQIVDDLLVLYGDVYTDIDVSKLIKTHFDRVSMFTTVVHESSHPHDSDLVVFDKKTHKVTEWVTKPHELNRGFSNAGLYIFNKKMLNYLPSKVPADFAHDFIPLLVKEGLVSAYVTEDFMMDMGTPERYNKLISLRTS